MEPPRFFVAFQDRFAALFGCDPATCRDVLVRMLQQGPSDITA